MNKLEPVEPDARDLQLASTYELPPCPFCGDRSPITSTTYRADTGIYRTLVICTRTECMAEIGANYRTKDAARKAAIIKWSRRV